MEKVLENVLTEAGQYVPLVFPRWSQETRKCWFELRRNRGKVGVGTADHRGSAVIADRKSSRPEEPKGAIGNYASGNA